MNTHEMIQILFPKTKNIEEVVEILHRYTRFGTNTNQRMAHFLAQVREEVGSKFKSISENLNYSEEAALKLFKNMTPELAEKYGRNKTHPANQEMIANIAYANRIGNGDIESGDGWKYRGAGVLQITGKNNYIEVQKRIEKYAPDTTIDILENDIHTLEGAILAGLGFWIWKDLYRYADAGTSHEDVDNITRNINKYTHSYEERREHFDKIKDLV